MNVDPSKVALLLVDLQNDFLARPALTPSADALCQRATTLLRAARRHALPIAHAHTVTRADGADRMPHWQRRGVMECVEGTRGVLPPAALAPVDGELVLRKRFFSAFGDPRLDPWLREHGVRRLIVAGVYLHGCVRSTVLDAYERDYEVCVADDAVGTTEPLHAEITRSYLGERAASFRGVAGIIAELDGSDGMEVRGGERLPVAVIAGARRSRDSPRRFIHRNPCRTSEVLSQVPLADAAEVEAAVHAAQQTLDSWAARKPSERGDCLERWADEIEARRAQLVNLIVREVAKPRRFAEEEIGRAVAHVRIAAELARDPALQSQPVAPGVAAAQRPLGVVGLITPWNNPLAIPVGKIAPAVGFGNTVVFKPAPEASMTATAIVDSLEHVCVPPGVVNVVCGDADTVRALCGEPRVAAIAVTGSIATGRTVAALCADSMKPVQAELGGNNAAIVLRDADLDALVPGLVRGAFGFAGQRCTAIRRFVVEEAVRDRFVTLARAAVAALHIGDPDDPATEVGPVISIEKRDRVVALIEGAVADGARLIAGGVLPHDLAHGAWLTPALLFEANPRSRVAQEETFGPVAVILPARDLDDAIAIANGVPHGLLMSVHTRDARARAHVREAAQAGIVQLGSGPLAVHPRAPFVGWKASGLGPPEHGVWDAAFYTRVQAVYSDESC
ncbi:MAG TPA: aldehyde dehydrogenase family protein [Candidatus Binatia bacterium]|nr:aldehyde dehydrogenase family protein [Candidatus Binatia bacterium]